MNLTDHPSDVFCVVFYYFIPTAGIEELLKMESVSYQHLDLSIHTNSLVADVDRLADDSEILYVPGSSGLLHLRRYILNLPSIRLDCTC